MVREYMVPRNLQRRPDGAHDLCSTIYVITAGPPKVGIQERSKTLAHSSAVVDWRGIASCCLLSYQ